MCKLFAIREGGLDFQDLTWGRGNSGQFETPIGAMLWDIIYQMTEKSSEKL